MDADCAFKTDAAALFMIVLPSVSPGGGGDNGGGGGGGGRGSPRAKASLLMSYAVTVVQHIVAFQGVADAV